MPTSKSEPDDDPSGYQRLIAAKAGSGYRWFVLFFTPFLGVLMLFYDRWHVFRLSGFLLIGLIVQLVRQAASNRKLGYRTLESRERQAIIETAIAFALLTAFVLLLSSFDLGFLQRPVPTCTRYGYCWP